MSEPVRVPNGLYGVAITDTKIAKSDASGSLTYRGYEINDIAENAPFEEAAYLILKGDLPTRNQLEDFKVELRSRMKVDRRVYDLMKLLPQDSHPMDVLRTAVSSLAGMEIQHAPWDGEISVAAKMPALVANIHRIRSGLEPLAPKEEMSFAENLLYMTKGTQPDELDSWTLERELIFYMEHDLNASSFTVRVVASTRADIYAAVTAGLAALKGPLHGGANEEAMEMLLKIKGPEEAKRYVESALRHGEKVPGFGHRIYKKYDPRAQLSKEYLRRLIAQGRGSADLLKTCEALENAMWEAKRLPANLDFYAAPVFFTLGIPIPLYTPIFAASRVFGWIAHYEEQIMENKLIRPDAVYIGPKALKYAPIDVR